MSNEEVREIQIAYFKAARLIWLKQFSALSAMVTGLKAVPPLKKDWSDLGELNGVADQLNRFADQLVENLLQKGAGHMGNVAQTLTEIAKNYVIAEAEATGEAAKLERMLDE